MAATKIPRVAVVGGGITGTLASLVLRNRRLSPLLIDLGKSGVGGRLRSNRSSLSRDAGAQFLRAADPRLAAVFRTFATSGLLAEWKGRFGLLGSAGGGFLPSSIVGNAGMRGMGRAADGRAHSDAGDFCGFVENHRESVPTYVGTRSNGELCANVCTMAGIDVMSGAKVVSASMVEGGGWRLQVEQKGEAVLEEEVFDALILASHDASLAARTVRAIADAEASAEADAGAGDSVLSARLRNLARDLQAVRDEGRTPLFTWAARFDSSTSVPFDAVSVPGSHHVQFLVREGSKPGRSQEGEVWTAVSTSALARDVLLRHGSTTEAREEITKVMSAEVAKLLSSAAASGGVNGGDVPLIPRDASAVRWGAALTSKTLGLKEDAVALAPWYLAIGGDFICEKDAYETPLEAAALSGLEAGERVAAFFAQQDGTG